MWAMLAAVTLRSWCSPYYYLSTLPHPSLSAGKRKAEGYEAEERGPEENNAAPEGDQTPLSTLA